MHGIYQGNGISLYRLSSGLELFLTDDDLSELSTPAIASVTQEIFSEIDSINNSIDDAVELVKLLDTDLKQTMDVSTYQAFESDISEVSTIIKKVQIRLVCIK